MGTLIKVAHLFQRQVGALVHFNDFLIRDHAEASVDSSQLDVMKSTDFHQDRPLHVIMQSTDCKVWVILILPDFHGIPVFVDGKVPSGIKYQCVEVLGIKHQGVIIIKAVDFNV